jgi:hypothetical protein
MLTRHRVWMDATAIGGGYRVWARNLTRLASAKAHNNHDIIEP